MGRERAGGVSGAKKSRVSVARERVGSESGARECVGQESG